MRTLTKLVLVGIAAAGFAVEACGDVPVDRTGGFPPAGVVQGTVVYSGPLPCSRGGHFVGNAVVLVFDARNPPPPRGLANTAVNFGVVSGDVLFKDWPASDGATKQCPPDGAPAVSATAPFVISPMDAGSYVIAAFFDYEGDFFPTLKPRNLPEALDVAGGDVDLARATELVDDVFATPATSADGGAPVYPQMPAQAHPNFLPTFLPVNVGVPGETSSASLHGVPDFTMPPQGSVTSDVVVTIGARLATARPYFHPEGVVLPAGQSNPSVTIGGSSASRASQSAPTPSNPDGNPDFVPVLSFPQDLLSYAQPTTAAVTNFARGGAPLLDAYQSGFPQLTLHAGVPLDEQAIAVDTLDVAHPFHMQLGLANPPAGAAPGGNGGLLSWWNACDGLPGCAATQDDFIPENAQVYRMWPLVVLAKLEDLPADGVQPSRVDPQAVVAQGSDLSAPVVIVQGITLFQDSLVATTTAASLLSKGKFLPPPTAPSAPLDHVSVMLRPSTLCLDPRAPDYGGVVVTPGASIDPTTQAVMGAYPPNDAIDRESGAPGIVVDSHVLSNPQLAQQVNRKAAGSVNGLMVGCLPTGRYEINVVYPTGQAWTTPNEAGSCASDEGATLFDGAGTGAGLVGTCAKKPRPTLYSQGTRAVVEITPAANPANCRSPNPTDGSIPAVPFACTSLCPSPRLDPTTSPPCAACLDPAMDPHASPPCSARLPGGAR